MLMINRAIFISSCDKTQDVAYYALLGLKKNWSDCPYPFFVGCNNNPQIAESLNGVALYTQVSTGWKEETLSQLKSLKEQCPELSHIIIMLDDFLLGKAVDSELVEKYYSMAVEREIKYLRLKKIESSIIGSIFMEKDNGLIKIDRDHPYYSSLQIAIWDIDYLIEQVESCHSIWDFENQVSESDHFSVISDAICYRHIVEKGKWISYAKNWCTRKVGKFEPGKRLYDENSLRWLWLNNLRFFIFGYTLMRIKKYVTKI